MKNLITYGLIATTVFFVGMEYKSYQTRSAIAGIFAGAKDYKPSWPACEARLDAYEAKAKLGASTEAKIIQRETSIKCRAFLNAWKGQSW